MVPVTLHRSGPTADRSARRRGAVLATLLACAALVLPASPASAAEVDLGWLRLDPASAKVEDVASILTETPCPAKATAVVVTLQGPNIPEGNTVGNIVGVTQLKALKPTLSGQLLVPLSFTFRDWFAVNAIQVEPGGTYTLTATCRDLLRASLTYGAFSGKVVLDGKGGFRAVGETAKAFNTELKPLDPSDPLAGGNGGTAPSAASSQPAAQGDPSSAPEPTAPAASGDGAVPAESEAPAAGVGTSASDARPQPDTTVRNVLLGVGGVLLVGLAFAGALRRPRREDEPVGQRERVDVL